MKHLDIRSADYKAWRAAGSLIVKGVFHGLLPRWTLAPKIAATSKLSPMNVFGFARVWHFHHILSPRFWEVETTP